MGQLAATSRRRFTLKPTAATTGFKVEPTVLRHRALRAAVPEANVQGVPAPVDGGNGASVSSPW